MWEDYTPYEWRTVGSFVRLGWRERAAALIDFFMADRRPLAWNQWPEVIGREYRKPRFIGDLPHGWVGSDFIRSALDTFAYVRESDQALLLAAGIPANWFEDEGIGIGNLRTPFGALSFAARKRGTRFTIAIDKGIDLPSGGLVFEWPWPEPPGATHINGKAASWAGRQLNIRTLPAKAVVELRREPGAERK